MKKKPDLMLMLVMLFVLGLAATGYLQGVFLS